MSAAEKTNILDMIEVKKRKPREKQPGRDIPTEPAGARQYFRALGYDRDRFFFFSAGSMQIHELTASRLGKKTELLMLAPLDWWEREFATDNGFSGRAVDMAANYLIQSCRQRGVFSPEKRRGRGVWLDGESIVIHAGDRLYINGIETALLEANTEAVYERQAAIPVAINDPLPVSESRLVIDFCKSLNYEQPAHAYLHAGWLVAAMIAGALRWRPHIQINGPKGSGKTTIVTVNVRLLAKYCLSVTGDTSAAGLRQTLASDALPVIFDEAEGDSQRAAAGIDQVLALMRHSSAGTDAKVIKGGADGRAQAITIQSCFCLASIRDQIQQAADQSRVSVLSLRPSSPQSQVTFNKITTPLADAISQPEFARRFQGRVFAKLPEVLQSIQVFIKATKDFFCDPRTGDQIGTLLGGSWMLWHDQSPSEIEAIHLLDDLSWTDQNELLAESSDEMACLRSILEAHIKVDGGDWHGELSIGELAGIVQSGTVVDAPIGLTLSDAARALARYGLKVDSGRLLVSNTNGVLGRKVMSHTTWPKGWGRVLARLPGAEKPSGPIYLGGQVTRVVSVPLEKPPDKPDQRAFS